jgi:hypothetical protein
VEDQINENSVSLKVVQDKVKRSRPDTRKDGAKVGEAVVIQMRLIGGENGKRTRELVVGKIRCCLNAQTGHCATQLIVVHEQIL